MGAYLPAFISDAHRLPLHFHLPVAQLQDVYQLRARTSAGQKRESEIRLVKKARPAFRSGTHRF
jgi:hypothetical protein